MAYGEDEQGEQMLREAFEADPEMVGHGQALAGLLEQRGRHAEALEVIDEGLRHRPGDEALTEMRERVLGRESR